VFEARTEIITASKKIVFATQYQENEVYSQYRKIIIRDYKILYKKLENKIYIMNVICLLAK